MPDDPQASLRAELIGRLVAAQFELEAALAKLRAGTDSVAITRGQISLSDLVALQRSVATATPAALAGMRAEIVAAAASIASDAKLAASGDSVGAAEQLANARTNARSAVRTVMDGMKDFDPYLRFTSREDEDAYRRREEDTRRAIEAALAKHTAAGDLQAARLTQAQLADAGAHGADASPEFASRVAAVNRAADGLEQATATAVSVPPSHRSDPLPVRDAPAATPADDDLAAVVAALKASGVSVPATQEAEGHGVAKNDKATTRAQSV